VDGACASLIDTGHRLFGWRLEVVRRLEGAKDFQVLPHRWVVERSFGWSGCYRRLARDYRHTVEARQGMMYWAGNHRTLVFAARRPENTL
jgi:putative transposase